MMSIGMNAYSGDVSRDFDSTAQHLIQYVSDYDLAQLTAELDKTGESKQNSGDLPGMKLKETDFLEQLEACNQLWLINGLIKELGTLELLSDSESTEYLANVNFETCVTDYIKLTTKTREFTTGLGFKNQPVKIVERIQEKIHQYEELIYKLIRLLLSQYLHFNDDSEVTYQNSIEELTFKQFLKNCNSFLNHESEMNDLSKLFNFNKLFNNWLEEVLGEVDFGKTVVLSYDLDSVVLKIEPVDSPSFMNYLKSVESLINFVNMFLDFNYIKEKYNPFVSLKASVSKTFLRSLKQKIFHEENIYPLMLDSLSDNDSTSNRYITQLRLISTLITQDGSSDLEFWIDDLVNYWVNDLVDRSIDEIKDLCTELKIARKGLSSELSDVFDSSQLFVNEISNSPALGQEKPAKSVAKTAENDDDDGWNNEWPSDEEDDKVDAKDEADAEEDAGDDDEWDAWDDNDNWKIDDDLRDANLGVKSLSTDSKTPSTTSPTTWSYRYSRLARLVGAIIDKFYANYEQLRSKVTSNTDLKDVEYLFKSSIKKLVVCYFMIIQSDATVFYSNWVLFYNDFSKLIEDVSSLYQVELGSCGELNSKLIRRYSDNHVRRLIGVLRPFEATLLGDNSSDNETRMVLSAELNSELTKFFESVNKESQESMTLNPFVASNVLANLIDIFCAYLSDKIVSRYEIDSDESEVLAKFIERAMLMLPEQSERVKRSASFQKLDQVKMVLLSNLKEILEDFYDAKYYGLETSELIRLLKSLFIDGPLRENVINEIVSIRGG